jgi:hypothetical protein
MFAAPSTSLHHKPDTLRPWPRWWLDMILAVLFLGPLLSPLFRATGQPMVDETGALARDLLALYICPTPAQSYMLFDYPMAVCARCWGATIGLWIARLWLPALLRRHHALAAGLHWFRGLPWVARLLLCGLPFLLWPLEIVGSGQGWWALPPLWVLLINGAQAGCAAGVFFLSVWPGFWSAAYPAADRH